MEREMFTYRNCWFFGIYVKVYVGGMHIVFQEVLGNTFSITYQDP
jgi:hypothetical protein